MFVTFCALKLTAFNLRQFLCEYIENTSNYKQNMHFYLRKNQIGENI